MQISFDALWEIICKNFFTKLVQSVSLCHRLFKKPKIIKILTTENCLKTQAVRIKARFYTEREGYGYLGKKFQQPQFAFVFVTNFEFLILFSLLCNPMTYTFDN